MNRRIFLAALPTLALAACQGTAAPTAATVAADVSAGTTAAQAGQTIVSTLTAALQDGTYTPAEQATVEAAIAQISTAAGTVGVSSGSAQIAGFAMQMQQALTLVAPIISGLAPLLGLIHDGEHWGLYHQVGTVQDKPPHMLSTAQSARIAAALAAVKAARMKAAAAETK